MPSQVDADAWNQRGLFHIFFKISSGNSELINETTNKDKDEESSKVPINHSGSPTAAPMNRNSQLPIPASTPSNPINAGTPKKATVNLISAKLRLYKIGEQNTAEV